MLDEKFKRGHNYKGFFFTFEGGEGTGKSTQIEQLADYLRHQGKEVLVGREPGGTDVGEQIRYVLQYSKQSAAMVPEAELLLFAASRAQLVREVIRPALQRGEFVLLDRYFDSTIAYQGVGRQLRMEDVDAINRFAIGDVKPDLTFLIDIDPRTGLARARGRELLDRIEALSLSFHDAVREGFKKIAFEDKQRVKIIDGSRSIGEIQAEIRGYASDFIANPPEYKPY